MRASKDDWRPGPEIERADHFQVGFCPEPNCGLHLLACREDGTRICEIVMSASQTLALIEVCQEELYDKATQQGD